MYRVFPAPSTLCAAQQIRHGEVLVRLDWQKSGRGVIRVRPVRTEPKENERLVPFKCQKRAESIRRLYVRYLHFGVTLFLQVHQITIQ